jgi:hypothetical protein
MYPDGPSKESATRRQHGAILLVMLVIMVIGAATILVSALVSSALQIERDKTTADALAKAKEALIGRAVVTDTSNPSSSPGSLPCPDTTNTGVADTISGGICPNGYIGRLPWKTLELPDLRDGSSERLWYALSPNFRDYAPLNPINSNNIGTLWVYDNSGTNLLTSQAVAIVFAPGNVVGTQQRDTANQNSPQNYLDVGPGPSNINNGNPTFPAGPFIAADKTSTFNDRLLIIQASDIIPVVEMRVAKELTYSFTGYLAIPANNNRYPYPANFNCTPPTNCTSDPTQCIGKIPATDLDALHLLPTWFTPNHWFDVIYYTAGTNSLPGGAGGGGGAAGRRGKGKKGGGVGVGVGGTAGCTPFLSVLDSNGTLITSNASALFLMPDVPIGRYSGITRTTMSTTNLPSYFEDRENLNLDNLYIMPTAISNDSLNILP